MYQKLRKELSKRNMTVYRLSQITGLNQSTLYNGLRYGCLFPKHRRLICDALNLEESALFTEEERGGKHVGK